jgi:hypothetical protein
MGSTGTSDHFDSATFDPDAFLASLVYVDEDQDGALPVPPVLPDGEEVLVRRTLHLQPTLDARLKAAAEARGITVEQLLEVLSIDAA